MMMEKTWSDFPVSFPPSRHGSNECRAFSTVTHVAHVKDAVRVMEDGRIRSSLVYDESRLNTKRTHVSWVSPKDWAHGYIYGNIAFVFDWRELVAEKRIYWVEYHETQRQHICRFLISAEKFTDDKLERYDYEQSGGPLFYDAKGDTWYHNDTVTSEYMIFADLPLRKCKAIDFVPHHHAWCNRSRNCPDMDRSAMNAGAEFLGRLIGAGPTEYKKLFQSRENRDMVDDRLLAAINSMYRRTVGKFKTDLASELPKSAYIPVMEGAIAAMACGQTDRAETLINLFPTQKVAGKTFDRCIEKFFDGLSVPND
jgi:hypothetical protein